MCKHIPWFEVFIAIAIAVVSLTFAYSTNIILR
jgi:hypothetical protein